MVFTPCDESTLQTEALDRQPEAVNPPTSPTLPLAEAAHASPRQAWEEREKRAN
jgi:hypothetical protein